ncbi:NUDIX domain-containing protein [Saccharothrix sp. NPDC042600]|uniref:NUDIX hydrolase n=1 Tax=Saccharothrix TaxID=2071 RepID=UPI00340F6A8B|nr:NUDIX domain-containing protein [Saccharothrix mutabilis subsp. capreolus]
MNGLLRRLWLGTGSWVQWRVLWLVNAKFMVSVAAVVRDENGRVLLLKHHFWREDRKWGLPSGYVKAGETLADAVVREVVEETGLVVVVGDPMPVYLGSGYRLRLEFVYEARYTGGEIEIDGFEIEQAGWFEPDRLPREVQETHQRLIRQSP